MSSDVIDLVWAQLQAEIRAVREQAQTALTRSERAETAGGVVACAYAQLPKATDGAADGDIYKVTNACKVGESTGAGTGTLCYYNPGDDTWRRVGDDAVVTI